MREIVPRTRRCGGQIADHVAGQAAYRRTCRSTRLGRWRRREQGAQNRLVDACSGHAAPMRPTSTMTDSTQNCDNRFVASLKNRRNCVTLHTSAMGGRPHEDPGIKRPVLRCQPDGIVMVAGVAAGGCGGCGGVPGVPALARLGQYTKGISRRTRFLYSA